MGYQHHIRLVVLQGKMLMDICFLRRSPHEADVLCGAEEGAAGAVVLHGAAAGLRIYAGDGATTQHKVSRCNVLDVRAIAAVAGRCTDQSPPECVA